MLSSTKSFWNYLIFSVNQFLIKFFILAQEKFGKLYFIFDSVIFQYSLKIKFYNIKTT